MALIQDIFHHLAVFPLTLPVLCRFLDSFHGNIMRYLDFKGIFRKGVSKWISSTNMSFWTEWRIWIHQLMLFRSFVMVRMKRQNDSIFAFWHTLKLVRVKRNKFSDLRPKSWRFNQATCAVSSLTRSWRERSCPACCWLVENKEDIVALAPLSSSIISSFRPLSVPFKWHIKIRIFIRLDNSLTD